MSKLNFFITALAKSEFQILVITSKNMIALPVTGRVFTQWRKPKGKILFCRNLSLSIVRHCVNSLLSEVVTAALRLSSCVRKNNFVNV